MDDFEKNYFKKLKELSTSLSIDRRELAKSRIKMFSAAMIKQLNENNFDLIVSAGNSGLIMAEITRLILGFQQTKSPPVITFPYYRFSKTGGTNISDTKPTLSDEIIEQINNLPQEPSILFIDDEIMRGLTAKACLEILIGTNPKISNLSSLILAENHFFEWHYVIPKTTVRFFAYSRLIQGFNGNIGFFIPENLFQNLNQNFPVIESYNHALALVLSGAVKAIDENNFAYFDFKLEKQVQGKLQDYLDGKNTLKVELKELIKRGIQDFAMGKIVFRS